MSESTKAPNPVQFRAKAANASQDDNAVNAGLAELAQLARQAFEEKRRKQSLALASAILKIDPEHAEGLVIQNWVRGDLQKDVEHARSLIEEAKLKNGLALYDRAEAALRAVLNVDPDDEQAKAVLQEVLAAQAALISSGAALREPEPMESGYPPPLYAARPNRWAGWAIGGAVVILLIALFKYKSGADANGGQAQTADTATAATAAPAARETNGTLDIFVMPTRGVQMSVDDAAAKPVPQTVELSPGPHRLRFDAEGYAPQTISQTIVGGKHQVLPVILELVGGAGSAPGGAGSASGGAGSAKDRTTSQVQTQPAAGNANKPAPAAAAKTNTPAARPANDAPQAASTDGSLAISSVIPVEVYMGGKHLGTAPLTLQLPQGLQTLEYRYDGLQKMVSHMIKTNETTRATIVFESTVQINARPWAEVSIEGPQGKDLGQTPLSNVTVPVGVTLVFRNPSFPEKRYRITSKDTTIQIVFP